MFNLVMKDVRLGIHPLFFLMPVLTGALMLIPGWIYFVVILYFTWITIPNVFNHFKAQNDLMFTSTMPVTKRDIVKARVFIIVGMELLHIVIAILYGLLTIRLYPEINYLFFPPTMGFWGLCFAMMAIFNIIFIPMYYKTSYKFGAGLLYASVAVALFAGFTQWFGIRNSAASDIFYGSGAASTTAQLYILIVGIVLFFGLTFLAYRIGLKRFLRVEVQ